MVDNIQRVFIPGDEWVYFKIYTGYKTADDILSQVLPMLNAQLVNDGVLRKWFFLRYSDPSNHLRLRFLVHDKKDVCQVISQMNKALAPYVEDGLVWKIQLDTYQREMERYGPSTMEHAESLFYYDSEAVVRILHSLDGREADRQRWLLTLVMLDSLLSDFRFNLDQKTTLLTTMSDGFKKEMGFTVKGFKLQLDKKYRENRKFIEEVMNTREIISWAQPALEAIKERSVKMEPIATSLLQIEEDQNTDILLPDLLSSFTHMMVNRMFRSKQRIYELVIYDMLERYYVSLNARNKRAVAV